jgi:hypothetical protein
MEVKVGKNNVQSEGLEEELAFLKEIMELIKQATVQYHRENEALKQENMDLRNTIRKLEGRAR